MRNAWAKEEEKSDQRIIKGPQIAMELETYLLENKVDLT